MSEVKLAKPRAGAIVQIAATHDGNLLAKVAGVGEILFDRSRISLECRHVAELKGWKFTLEDAAAKSCDTSTGKSASPQDKFDAIKAIAEHYMSGVTVWGRKGAGGSREDDSGLTIMGLMRAKGWDLEKANAWIANVCEVKSLERKAVLANVAKNPDVIRAIGEIKAERAAQSAVNAADFLDELGDAGDEEAGA